MDEEIGHGAAAEIPVPAPVCKLVGIERAARGRAQKTLPVEFLHFDLRPAGLVGNMVLKPVRPDQGHLPEGSRADQFLGVYVVLPTALLGAGLHHSFRLANRRQQGRFLRQRVGHRLFAIDVFARSDRIDGDGYVPVVRRADNDGIDILAVQNLPVIHVLTHFAGKPGLSLGAVWCIDVAHCDDLGALDMLGIADEILPTAAGADGCDADAAVGAPNTPIGRRSDCGSAEKSPPVGSPINGLVGHRDLLPVHHKLLACARQTKPTQARRRRNRAKCSRNHSYWNNSGANWLSEYRQTFHSWTPGVVEMGHGYQFIIAAKCGATRW